MGLSTGLFSSKAQQLPGREKVVFLLGLGNFDLEIVGIAAFQAALETICGPHRLEGVKRFETAGLIVEDENPAKKMPCVSRFADNRWAISAGKQQAYIVNSWKQEAHQMPSGNVRQSSRAVG
jgi:hypothetical protein